MPAATAAKASSATSSAAAKTATKSTKTVKELTSGGDSASKPAKRDLETSESVSQAVERPSSFGNVALVSVKEEELSQLGEGKSIEITFDAPVTIDASNSTITAASSSSGGAAVVAVQAADDQAAGNAKRFKLDLDSSSSASATGDFVGGNGGSGDMSETTQVDLDDMLTGLSCSVCK